MRRIIKVATIFVLGHFLVGSSFGLAVITIRLFSIIEAFEISDSTGGIIVAKETIAPTLWLLFLSLFPRLVRATSLTFLLISFWHIFLCFACFARVVPSQRFYALINERKGRKTPPSQIIKHRELVLDEAKQCVCFRLRFLCSRRT